MINQNVSFTIAFIVNFMLFEYQFKFELTLNLISVYTKDKNFD